MRTGFVKRFTRKCSINVNQCPYDAVAHVYLTQIYGELALGHIDSIVEKSWHYVSIGDQGLSCVANMASARESVPGVCSSTRPAWAKGVKGKPPR